MNRIQSTLLLLASSAALYAGPAKRNMHTLQQPDGTTIQAISAGDEFAHYFIDGQGQRLQRNAAGYWTPLSAVEVERQEAEVQAKREARFAPKRRSGVQKASDVPSKGERHLLTLLVQFSNRKFTLGTNERYNEMLNGVDYTYQGATGSAQRYFRDQSNEQYTPIFDIVGPITLDQRYQYYGGNSSSGDDLRPRQMISEAITQALEGGMISNLAQYDGNGDGYVDLIYVFYAGYSESEDAEFNADCIWPHAWSLSSTLSYNGIKISEYACSSELQGTPADETVKFDGIGSCVHEFSHCLGLPDFYNTGYKSGCYGMDTWSVMDQGCYNGDGRTPASYTAYERNFVGWMDLTPLPTEGQVTLYPIDTAFHAYVYHNAANKDEYFIFENHQNQGWDTYFGYYGAAKNIHGMLITHVDYNATAWMNNQVNNKPDHQRYTVIPADGVLIPYDQVGVSVTSSVWGNSFIRDIWPSVDNVRNFSPATSPRARFYTGDDATFDISEITEKDGVITFNVRPYNANSICRPNVEDEVHGFVDLYDLTGKRVLSGVSMQSVHSSSLPEGVYLIKKTNGETRKIVR